MDQKVENYYRTKLRGAKFLADLGYFFSAGLFFTLLDTTGIDITDLFADTQQNPHFSAESDLRALWPDLGEALDQAFILDASSKLWALIWLILSALRILFLLSSWRGGPLLKWSGLYLDKTDGSPLTIGDVLKYSVIEWLPMHLFSLFVLSPLFSSSIHSLFAHGAFDHIKITAQILWIAPFIFLYKGRNCAEFLSGVTVAFTEKKENKILKKTTKALFPVTRTLNLAGNYFIYLLFVVPFLFVSIQILRTPAENPEYQKALYSGYQPIWTDNTYFAIMGLPAPADVKNFYRYGLKRTYYVADFYERLKADAHINYPYPIPKIEGLDDIVTRLDQLEIIDRDSWNDLGCLYEWEHEVKKGKKCATSRDFITYITQNKIIWERFNKLPAIGNAYRVPPRTIIPNPGPGIEFIYASELKAVQIVKMAQSGEKEQALREWLRYIELYKSMAHERGNLVDRALLMIVLKRHERALETLLFEAPDLAVTYYKELRTALNDQTPIFREGRFIRDELAQFIPLAIVLVGNVNAVHNDLYECIRKASEQAEMPFHLYPFGKKTQLCPLERRISAGTIFYSLLTPGYPIANWVISSIIKDIFKGKELEDDAKIYRVRFRMASLAVTALSEGVTADTIETFIQTVPEDLQNPITLSPFLWDAQKSALYFEDPYPLEREEEPRKEYFRLNLQKTGHNTYPQDLQEVETSIPPFELKECGLPSRAWISKGENKENQEGNQPLISICVNSLVPVQDALTELSRQAGYKLILERDVRGTIEFGAKNMPFDTVISHICERAGLDCAIEEKTITVR